MRDSGKMSTRQYLKKLKYFTKLERKYSKNHTYVNYNITKKFR